MKPLFRNKLKQGDRLLGTLITLPTPEIAEIFARAGFDWLFIDMEHSTLDPREAQRLIQAAGERVDCILRVPLNDEIWIKKALDTGCTGLMIPQVNSLADAQRAVRFSKYPPQGTRSVGITRAHGFGASSQEYLANANEETVVIIQIEHKDAVMNLNEILTVEGIDAVFIGPYDLSSSMGLVGQLDHPEVKTAIEHVRQTCQKRGVPLGIFSTSTRGAAQYLQEGYRLIAVSSDILMLVNSAEEIIKSLQH